MRTVGCWPDIFSCTGDSLIGGFDLLSSGADLKIFLGVVWYHSDASGGHVEVEAPREHSDNLEALRITC